MSFISLRPPHWPAIALIALCLFAARPASASWQCPVGAEPLGENNTGVACVWVDDDAGVDEDDGYDGYSPPPMHHYSPEEWQAFIDAGIQAEREAEAKRMKDPKYRALKAGTWDFSESPAKSKQH